MNYTLDKTEFHGYEQTVKEIYNLADKYYLDLMLPNKHNKKIELMTPKGFFEFIKSLPYVSDKDEFLNRPKISLELAGTGHYFDCDDRTILSLSFFKLKNNLLRYPRYNVRVVVTGRYTKPAHVFIEYQDSKNTTDWLPFDPTYPHNKFHKYLYKPGFYRAFKIVN
jgi:hypothetical protein